MAQKKVLLKVNRFMQEGDECAIAASSAMANYYDENVVYSNVRKMVGARQRASGLYSSQQGRLLNKLGFEKVTIVTNDLDLVDYSWRSYSHRRLLNKLRRMYSYYMRTKKLYQGYAVWVRDLIGWLEDSNYENHLVIDQDFPLYIKRSLNKGHPVGASFNATTMFQLRKEPYTYDKCNSDIKGGTAEHAVVIRGYDDKGVYVVDSDSGYYLNATGNQKYKSGYYKVPWGKFLMNMPSGDLILVD